jgi:hypothetical protein
MAASFRLARELALHQKGRDWRLKFWVGANRQKAVDGEAVGGKILANLRVHPAYLIENKRR